VFVIPFLLSLFFSLSLSLFLFLFLSNVHRDIPIVHRVLKVHEKASGQVDLLTKGDNNRVDDRGLYAPGQQFINRDDILGRAVGTLRYVGMVTIVLNDYPALKYVLVAVMGKAPYLFFSIFFSFTQFFFIFNVAVFFVYIYVFCRPVCSDEQGVAPIKHPVPSSNKPTGQC
jgi:hypothetical protein